MAEIDKEKIKEIVNDPAKLEAKIKEYWGKIDEKGEGSVPLEVLKAKAEAFAKNKGLLALPSFRPPTEEEKAKFKQLVDPNNTGKIDLEGFRKAVHAGIEKAKKAGKL